jgi:hypothetical protein
VTMGAGLRPPAKAGDLPPDPTVGAPALYPTRYRASPRPYRTGGGWRRALAYRASPRPYPHRVHRPRSQWSPDQPARVECPPGRRTGSPPGHRGHHEARPARPFHPSRGRAGGRARGPWGRSDRHTPGDRHDDTCRAADVPCLERIAEFERDLIRERVIAGIRRAQAQGRHVGRPAKYRVDPMAARNLLAAAVSLRGVARQFAVHRSAVRRALLRGVSD